MKTQEIIRLFQDFLLKVQDPSLRKELEVLIRKLKKTIDNQDQNDNDPPDKTGKKKTYKVVDLIGQFFVRLGTSALAKELLNLLHQL
jgi:hypothetical protein